MLIKTIFAGFGGQGVLLMGQNVAQAAMIEGKSVTYLPSYGVEVRGGTANCTVAVSDEEIASPVASAPEFIVVMNEPSLVRFQNQVQSGGLLFVNSSLAASEISRGDVDVIGIPASDIAGEMGSPKSANMVMLGVFVKRSNLVDVNSVIESLRNSLKTKKKLLATAEKVLIAGYNLT
ncbi:MAG: 2-oxoacid:acceptor oxidoreductase family protein [Dehalococcoidales bacterium]|nr:2-oxoacid:acceptor oxidoreductase family protein [Dehalococcoidales bacterium]